MKWLHGCCWVIDPSPSSVLFQNIFCCAGKVCAGNHSRAVSYTPQSRHQCSFPLAGCKKALDAPFLRQNTKALTNRIVPYVSECTAKGGFRKNFWGWVFDNAMLSCTHPPELQAVPAQSCGDSHANIIKSPPNTLCLGGNLAQYQPQNAQKNGQSPTLTEDLVQPGGCIWGCSLHK